MPEPRGCRSSELPAVAHLCNQVFRSQGGDMGAQYPLLFHPENARRLRTVWEGGIPVCHAGYLQRDCSILGTPIRTAMVGAVCTHPEHRGRGLATAVMADLEKQARDEGCDLLLVSGGRGLYRRMGCSRAGRFTVYTLARRPDPPLAVSLRSARPADAAALTRLYQFAPVRFERSVDDWEAMIGAGYLMNSPAENWIVEYQGEPVGYFGAQQLNNDGEYSVLEYGGSALAVWAGLCTIERERIQVVVMPGDQEIPLLAGEESGRLERSFPGTVKVLAPARSFDRAERLLYERIGREAANDLMVSAPGEAVTFEWAGEEMEFSPDELPGLIFGPDPEAEDPARFPEGPLGEILNALFPLPLPWYGYDYT